MSSAAQLLRKSLNAQLLELTGAHAAANLTESNCAFGGRQHDDLD